MNDRDREQKRPSDQISPCPSCQANDDVRQPSCDGDCSNNLTHVFLRYCLTRLNPDQAKCKVFFHSSTNFFTAKPASAINSAARSLLIRSLGRSSIIGIDPLSKFLIAAFAANNGPSSFWARSAMSPGNGFLRRSGLSLPVHQRTALAIDHAGYSCSSWHQSSAIASIILSEMSPWKYWASKEAMRPVIHFFGAGVERWIMACSSVSRSVFEPRGVCSKSRHERVMPSTISGGTCVGKLSSIAKPCSPSGIPIFEG